MDATGDGDIIKVATGIYTGIAAYGCGTRTLTTRHVA